MITKYLLLGLAKLFAFIFAPGYLIGLASGLLGGTSDKDRILWARKLSVSLILVVQIILVIDKGRPFFFGNLYNMASMDPKLAVALAVGIIGDGLWYLLTIKTAVAFAATVQAKMTGVPPDVREKSSVKSKA